MPHFLPPRTFTISPYVRELLRSGIFGYTLVIPDSLPVSDEIRLFGQLGVRLGASVEVMRDERLADGTFYLMSRRYT